jgi:hypothetical protein
MYCAARGSAVMANVPHVERLLRLGGLFAVLGALAAAPAAHAGSTQASFFQDDRLLTSNNPVEQANALNTLRFLGVDTIHTVVNWSRITGQQKPSDPSNPATYPVGGWDAYDSLVRGAGARGIKVMMSPAGPVPNFASGCKRNTNKACRPRPKLYGQFVQALGKRYSGSYVDEDQDQTQLPAVRQWTMWNEPNLSSWLYPQTVKHRAVGAGLYRGLVYAGTAALRATGHKRDLILVGETAPIGGNSRNTSPRDFLLGLFCVNGRGHRLHGRSAKRLGCRKAKRIQARGLSHHPYSRGAGVPTGTHQKPGSLTMGVIGRFVPILRAARHSRVAPRRLGVYMTEFGVTTRPPDRKFGVALSRQAQYINEVDYLAYKRPWIKSVSQFQLADDINLGTRTFQTGLLFGDGKQKVSFGAYRTPIFVVRKKHGRSVEIFGQARPGGSRTVRIQFRKKGKKTYKTVVTKRTNRAGYVLVRRRAAKGLWRIAWTDADGSTIFSRGSQSVPGSSPATPGVPPPGPGTPPTAPPPSANPGTPPPSGGGGTAPSPQYTLIVSVNGGLFGGHVTSSPAGIDCTSGSCQAQYATSTVVTLTASHSALQSVSWTGCDSNPSADTCTVTMTGARQVTASYSP